MNSEISNNPRDQEHEQVIASGKIFELVQTTQADGRVFEVARRAPGVRLIIVDAQRQKVLLTKEFRKELHAWDYRLPGGKVFDSLGEYQSFRGSGEDMLDAATLKVKAEAREEAGIDVNEVRFFKKSTLGATVEWDLYVFETSDWQEHIDGQALETGEEIETNNWFTYDEIKDMIVNGAMKEERIALIMYQWITKQLEEQK